MRGSSFAKAHALAVLAFAGVLPSALRAQQTITGEAAFAGYTQQEGMRGAGYCEDALKSSGTLWVPELDSI